MAEILDLDPWVDLDLVENILKIGRKKIKVTVQTRHLTDDYWGPAVGCK